MMNKSTFLPKHMDLRSLRAGIMKLIPAFPCRNSLLEMTAKRPEVSEHPPEVGLPRLTEKGRAAFKAYKRNMQQVLDDLPE